MDIARKAVIVVGAGRSGTSVITASLGPLGIDLGDKLVAGGLRKNPKGFFEDKTLLDINHRLHRRFQLKSAGTNVRPIEPREWSTTDFADLEDEALAAIDRQFGSSPLWGLKSGGLLRLFPFWQRVFEKAGVEPTFVLALRNPLGVADSRANLDFYRGFQEKSDLEWLVQVVPYFDRLRSYGLVAVDYDVFMYDRAVQMKRVAKVAGIELTAERLADIDGFAKDFATDNLYHHRYTPHDLEQDERVNPLTRQAYLLLHRLAVDEISTADPEFWDQMAEVQQRYQELGPVLRYLDFVEDRARAGDRGLSGLIKQLDIRLGLSGRKQAQRTT